MLNRKPLTDGLSTLPMNLYNLNVEKFTTYVKEAGAELLETTNQHEVLRFRCKEGVGIVYFGRRGFNLQGAALTAHSFFARRKRWRASKHYQRYEKPEMREALLQRDGNTCFYCGVDMLEEDMTIEHLLSKAHGGTSIEENLVVVHESCNKQAGSLPLPEKIKMFFARKEAE